MRILIICAAFGLAACSNTPPTREEAADRCEDRAQAAQAPRVGASVGVNNKTGTFGGLSIGVTSDFLRGRDPVEVYESCVIDLTGETPVRPVRLRS